MIRQVKCPKEIKIFDRGPEYMDRFTVIMPDDEVWCMSTNALSPNGICRYEGRSSELSITKADVLCKTVPVHVACKAESLRV